jgi:hypothetical protein
MQAVGVCGVVCLLYLVLWTLVVCGVSIVCISSGVCFAVCTSVFRYFCMHSVFFNSGLEI